MLFKRDVILFPNPKDVIRHKKLQEMTHFLFFKTTLGQRVICQCRSQQRGKESTAVTTPPPAVSGQTGLSKVTKAGLCIVV